MEPGQRLHRESSRDRPIISGQLYIWPTVSLEDVQGMEVSVLLPDSTSVGSNLEVMHELQKRNVVNWTFSLSFIKFWFDKPMELAYRWFGDENRTDEMFKLLFTVPKRFLVFLPLYPSFRKICHEIKMKWSTSVSMAKCDSCKSVPYSLGRMTLRMSQ